LRDPGLFADFLNIVKTKRWTDQAVIRCRELELKVIAEVEEWLEKKKMKHEISCNSCDSEDGSVSSSMETSSKKDSLITTVATPPTALDGLRRKVRGPITTSNPVKYDSSKNSPSTE